MDGKREKFILLKRDLKPVNDSSRRQDLLCRMPIVYTFCNYTIIPGRKSCFVVSNLFQ